MGAKAEIEISASDRQLASGLASAQRRFDSFADHVARGTSKAFGPPTSKRELLALANKPKSASNGPGVLGQALGHVGGVMMTRGIDALADIGMGVFDFEKRLVRLQIASGKTPEYMQAFGRSVRAASDATGIDANEILKGSQAYLALTGDMDGAAAAANTWARVAEATDAPVAEIAQTAAALKQNLKIDPSQMEAAFSALAIQGKEGAIELKDLSTQLSSIAPQWAQFGRGSGLSGLRELGAALQVVKQGFGGDAGETVTGLASMLTALSKHAGHFRGVGVSVFEKDGKTLRNVLDIVKQISGKKMNAEQLEKLFGRDEAYRAYLQLSQNSGLLDDLIAKSKDEGVIERDRAAHQQSTAGKLEVAWAKAKNSIAEAFTPERIEAFVGALATAAGWFAKLVGFVSDLADTLGVTDKTKSDAVKQAISGTSIVDDMTRTILGEELGIKGLQGMTPAQRADALAKASGESETFGIGNVNAAGRAYQHNPNNEIRRAGALPSRAEFEGGIQVLTGALASGFNLPQADVQATMEAAMRAALADLAQEIADALAPLIGGRDPAPPPVVKIGDNQVAKSVSQATNARTRTH